jgi:hypothetical protein
MSSLTIHIESIKWRRLCSAWCLASLGTWLQIASRKMFVAVSCHALHTALRTSSSIVVRSLIMNKKSGHVGSRWMTWNVILVKDHTLRWRSICHCVSVRLYMRKEIGAWSEVCFCCRAQTVI